MNISWKRWACFLWLIAIAGFAAVHAVHLRADFPNHSPWIEDWAKYTDEGWYGNAAVRAHLFGNWYLKDDFNPAPAVPVWPFCEWLLFFATGVRIEAARALAVSFFALDLLLGYLLLRSTRGPRWVALAGVTLAVTSPFLYSFSRLAILEPMLMAFLLAALNMAVRLAKWRRPLVASAAIGVLFTLMLLTKATAVFLLAALGWALIAALKGDRRKMLRSAAAAALGWAATFGAWIALVAGRGFWPDYKYLFFVNTYPKPKEWYWPLLSLWYAVHGCGWGDPILLPLAGAIVVVALIAVRTAWGKALWREPVFGASVTAVAGYILFMAYQNHPQARYYTVVALFAFFIVVLGAERLLAGAEAAGLAASSRDWKTLAGAAVLCLAIVAAGRNAAWTLAYAAHPEYTWVNAAANLTRYIDEHPNGRRMLVSVSGDEIGMIAHLPSLCDDFGTVDLPVKLKEYQPGWWATWNDIDPGTLEDLHMLYSLDQVAKFRAFDHPERNLLVLFKLHPLARPREYAPEFQQPMPEDRIEIPIQ